MKTEESAGDVPIDTTLVSLLHGFRARAHGKFVIEAGSGVTASRPWGQRYRCDDIFYPTDAMAPETGRGRREASSHAPEGGWLDHRDKGRHLCRKSKFLRHADIRVTAMHYADHKER